MAGLDFKVAIATWTARFIPLLLISMAGYVTYVVIGLLCVNHLLVKENDAVTAISILVTYCLLVILLIATFLRLTYTTYCDPPYVPLGNLHTQKLECVATGTHYINREKIIPHGLESFYEKEVFVSDHTGRPLWCSQCANWKPDRAHHCSQAGRCIKRMDHFCPWVGGPIGENNFKFFIQFTSYGTLYCIYVLIVVATIIWMNQNKNVGSPKNMHNPKKKATKDNTNEVE